MRPCIKCGHIKFWFQFFIRSVSDCDHVNRSDVCKGCANVLKIGAVRRYERSHGNEEMMKRMEEDG